MNIILKAILEGAANTFANAGEQKLEEVLQKLHDTNKPLWLSCIWGGFAFCIGLNPLVLSTGTKIDDAVLNAIKQSVVENAAANGLTLTETGLGLPNQLQSLHESDPEAAKALISDFVKANNIVLEAA